MPHPFRAVVGCTSHLAFGGRELSIGYGAEDLDCVPASTTGVIEGQVTYHADSRRPWRYARYCIKRAKSGELAEAVVAIRGKSLDKASAPAAPRTVVIDQKNFQFQPETVVIRQSDSVKFTNSDPATHNVRISSGIAGMNETMAGGESYTARFDRAGGICPPLQVGGVFHSAMRAWVFVFDHPLFQRTKADGRFRPEDVPPGSYELEMNHPADELRWRRRIEVKAGETLHFDIPVSPDDKK